MPRSNSGLWKLVPLPCVQCCWLHTSQKLGQARSYHFLCVTCSSDGASGCSIVTSSPEPLSLSLHLYLFCLTPSEAWNVALPFIQNLVPLVGLRHFFFRGPRPALLILKLLAIKAREKQQSLFFFTFTFTIELPRPSLVSLDEAESWPLAVRSWSWWCETQLFSK